MPGLDEIKSSIDNVKNTRKTTKAMYLISAAKSRDAKAKLEKARSYFNKIALTLSEIIAETEGLVTPYFGDFENPPESKKLYLVLSGDKGQAGAYNHNIISLLEKSVNKENSILWVAGFMGRTLIRNKGFTVDSNFNYPVVDPNLYRARDVMELATEAYLEGRYEQVFLVYTDMVTALNLVPRVVQLLPLKPEDMLSKIPPVKKFGEVLYEPNPKAVFGHLAPHYLKGIIYGAFVDSFTSEQHARMFAMDKATNSANDMIETLSRRFNRIRQAQITQEINEIVGGIPTE